MSTNLDFLNNLITLDDKTDDILEQKIRENEANIQALENLDNLEENSNITKKDDNNGKESFVSKKNAEDANHINKVLSNQDTFSKNGNCNDEIKMNNSSVTPLKKEKKLKDNNSSSSNKVNITTTNISNTNNSNMNISINLDNKKSSNGVNGKYYKKDTNYCPVSEKRRNNKKKVTNFSKNNNNLKYLTENSYLYDNVDQSLYYQYTALLENQRFLNKSAQKRPVHNHKKNNNDKIRTKNNSKNKDINDDKFSYIYKRFEEVEKKQKEKLAKLKKNKEEQDNKKYLYKPQINKKSIELTSKNKDDFYTRQKKMMEEQKKKDALLREKVKKKEREEINKTNSLLTIHNMSRKFRDKKSNKERRKSVDETINKLYEWDVKRKEKIINKIKNKEKNSTINVQQKPEINKRSYQITVNRNPNQIFHRLYKVDIAKRKQKQEILNQIYTPSFQPFLGENSTNISKVNLHKNIKKEKEKNKNKSVNYFENHNISHYKNLQTNEEDTLNTEDYNIMIISNVNDLMRERIFSKMKNKSRYRGAIKLNVIRDENINDYNFNKGTEYNDINKLMKNNSKKTSSSYIRRIKRKIEYD